MENSTRPKRRLILFGLICFLAGGLLVYLTENKTNSKYPPTAIRVAENKYKFIDPLLLCNNDAEGALGEIEGLSHIFKNLVEEKTNDEIITEGSVYFRDLSSGRWSGANYDKQYSPASLLKVPILMAYLKTAEKDLNLLQKTALYIQDPNQSPPLVNNPILVSGQRYRVEDLLRGMIIDSDNTATKMLMGGIGGDALNQAYTELGLPNPYTTSNTYTMSTRTYALFFRILYNATFLSRDMSEKALSILSEAKFNKGLVSGTPAGTPIAQKYGYAIIKKDPTRIIELSDCGIIYHPQKPYLLCVMGKGSDPDIVSTFIKNVAEVTAEYLEKNIVVEI